MILFVDLGNCMLKWCLSSAYDEVQRDTLEDFIAKVATFKHLKRAYINSVRDQHQTNVLVEALRFSTPHVELIQTDREKLDSVYSDITQLGIDRWLAMLGAIDYAPCLVVDIGTALTIDQLLIIDGQPHHSGGWIAPGPRLMQQSLHANTALPAGQHHVQAVWGNDTQSCIHCGVENTCIATISQAQRNTGLKIVMTGGGAVALQHKISEGCAPLFLPDLIFRGARRAVGLY